MHPLNYMSAYDQLYKTPIIIVLVPQTDACLSAASTTGTFPKKFWWFEWVKIRLPSVKDKKIFFIIYITQKFSMCHRMKMRNTVTFARAMWPGRLLANLVVTN